MKYSKLLILLSLFITLNSYSQSLPKDEDIFVEIYPDQFLPAYSGASAWGDYDNDGDLDLIHTGFSSEGRIAYLYKNTSTGFILDQTFEGVDKSAVAWGDYDCDGDLDLVISGSQGLNNSTSFYQNEDGFFSPIFNFTFPGFEYGCLSWGDMDNDGDLDLFLSGYDDNNEVSALFRNDDGIFHEVENTGIIATSHSKMGWADFDKDLDIDLFLTGISDGDKISMIFENTDTGFIESCDSNFLNVYQGDMQWGDMDNDADMDLLVSGQQAYQDYSFKLYENTGGCFVESNPGFFPDVMAKSVDWGDYNNDGLLDLIFVSGDSEWNPVTKLYKNTGTGFEEEQNSGLPGCNNGMVDWGDFDNDGDLDLFFSGYIGGETIAKLFENTTPVSNNQPNPPLALDYTLDYTNVILSWSKGTDAETPGNGLSYNLRVGNSPGSADIFSPHVITDTLTLPSPGNVQNDTAWYIRDLSPGTYYWAVQTIDNGFLGSDFSLESAFEIPGFEIVVDIYPDEGGAVLGSGVYLEGDSCHLTATPCELFSFGFWEESDTILSYDSVFIFPVSSNRLIKAYFLSDHFVEATDYILPAVNYPKSDWGDFDNDGDMDLVLSGSAKTRIYKNTSSGMVELYPDGLINGSGHVAWGDYDNDNDLDILFSGYSNSLAYVTLILENTGDGFSVGEEIILDNAGGLASWGDFDNDGDLDIVMAAFESYFVQNTRLFENIDTAFQEIDPGSLFGVKGYYIRWGDYDNDSDLDLLIGGFSQNDGVEVNIYENTEVGFSMVFEELTLDNGNCAGDWADFNNDGMLDFILAGSTGTFLYQNIGDGFEEVYPNTFPTIYSGHVEWADYDNDGDLDLFMGGSFTEFGLSSMIFNNTGDGFVAINEGDFEGVYQLCFDWVDFDNDLDLDIFIAGTNGDEYSSTLYRNNTFKKNLSPDFPEGFQVSQSAGYVTLAWDHGSDSITPQDGLMYNLRISTEPDQFDIKSPMSDFNDGYLKTMCYGNIQADTFYTLKNIETGDYYWSVQTIDQSHRGSGFSSEQYFSYSGFNISIASEPSEGGLTSGEGIYQEGEICTVEAFPSNSFDFINWTEEGEEVSSDFQYSFSVEEDRNLVANFICYHFVNINANITGVTSSATDWGDFDNDGDLDLLITGTCGFNTSCSKIYENTDGVFNEVYEGELTNVWHGDAAWGDYDGDEDLDIILCGFKGTSSSERTTSLFENTGDGFIEVNEGMFLSMYYAALDWGDFDNDGDLDLVICGESDFGYKTILYENDNQIFREVYTGSLMGLDAGDVQWGDMDNDGDLDIVIAGYNGSSSQAKVYENTGTGFEEMEDYLLWGMYDASLDLGDYDSDGDLDVILNGKILSSNNHTRIYENTGSGFNVVFEDELEDIQGGGVNWGDYDGDGDLDILITGGDSEGDPCSKIYNNRGDEFIEEYSGDLTNVFNGTSQWGDYDNDGDLDILISGYAGSTDYRCEIYMNTRPETNTAPELPQGLTANQLKGGMMFSWEKAFDAETAQDGLTYNLRVGSTPGTSNIVSPHAKNTNGKRLVMGTGNAGQSNELLISPLLPGTYYWSVQTLDNNFEGSGFAEEFESTVAGYEIIATVVPQYTGYTYGSGTYIPGSSCTVEARAFSDEVFSHWEVEGAMVSTEVQYTFIADEDLELEAHFLTTHFTLDQNVYLPKCTFGDIMWGDYDGDNDLDIMLMGPFGLSLYKNTFGHFEVDDPYTLAFGSQPAGIAWGDIDNDNDLDIIYAGKNYASSAVTIVYENTNEGYTEIYPNMIEGFFESDIDLGDFDNDGDQDILIAGSTDSDTLSCIYLNDGNGFTSISCESLTGVISGSVRWGDYDSDGDQDILISGQSKDEKICKIYQNNNLEFNEVYQDVFPGIGRGVAEWIDYDSDGDLDVFVSGEGDPLSLSKLFNNNGSGFDEVYAGIFQALRYSYASWGDFDNDGDPDLLLGGDLGPEDFTSIYENVGDGFELFEAGDLAEAYRSRALWGDYDNDGDLDFLYSDNTYNSRSKVYRNNGLVFNTLPSEPTNLQAEIIEGDFYLFWDASSDFETGQAGLSYNIRIGNSPQGTQFKSAEASTLTGHQFRVKNGNVGQNTTWVLKDVAFGTYFWSVQAIDQGFSASSFAIENSIAVLDTFSVNLISSPSTWGTTIGSGAYTEGDSCHAIPVPLPDYGFLSWTESDTLVSEDSVYSFVVTQNRELIANFYLLVGQQENYIENRVEVFPNPFDNVLNIGLYFDKRTFLKVKLLDMSMRELEKKTINIKTGTLTLELEKYPSGLYILAIENAGKEKIYIRKVVKMD